MSSNYRIMHPKTPILIVQVPGKSTAGSRVLTLSQLGHGSRVLKFRVWGFSFGHPGLLPLHWHYDWFLGSRCLAVGFYPRLWTEDF